MNNHTTNQPIQNIFPVVCIESVDLSEVFYVERGHFYQIANEEDKYILIDYFNRSFQFELSKASIQHFKEVTQEQFDEYEECCNEGYTDEISSILAKIFSEDTVEKAG